LHPTIASPQLQFKLATTTAITFIMNLITCITIAITFLFILAPSSTSTAKALSEKLDCEQKLRDIDEAVANISIALAKNARPFVDEADFAENYCRYVYLQLFHIIDL
jgi:hypothetical protein